MATLRLSDTPTSDLLRGGPTGAQNAQLLSSARQGVIPPEGAKPQFPRAELRPVNPATGAYVQPGVPNGATGQAARAAGNAALDANAARAAGVGGVGGAVPPGSAAAVPGAQQPGRLAGLRTGLSGAKEFLTSPGAAGTSAGQTLRSVGGGVVSGAKALLTSPFTVAGAGIAGAYDGLKTDTETYAKRFGLDTPSSVAGDLGVRALGVASDVGNRLTFGGLGMLQNKLYGEGQWEGRPPGSTPTPTTTAPTAGSAPTDPKTGLTQQGTVNTAALDNVRTSLNNDPGMRQGMTNAQVGAINPAGRVTATRQPNGVMSFSDGGRGPVTGAVSYVGANGEASPGAGLRGGGFGTVSTVPGMSKEQIGEIMARPTAGGPFRPGMSAADNVRYNQEVESAQRINAFGAAQSRIMENSDKQRIARNAAFTAGNDMEMRPGESRAAYATRIGAMTQRRGQDLDETQSLRSDGTQRRGQDITSRGQDMTQATTLRGQDMDLQGRLLPKQMEMQYNAQMRAARAQIFQQAGGDPAKAAQIAQAYGMDPKDFLESAASSEALGAARVKSGRAAVENMSITQDKDDNPVINEAVTAQNAAVANQLTDGRWNSMSAAERAAATPRVQAGTNVFQGMNSLRDTGFLQAVGIDDPSPAYDKLPDMQGAKEGTVGYLEGMTTFGGVSKGDRKVTLRDGSVRYIPNGKLGDAERTLLREMGVTLQGN